MSTTYVTRPARYRGLHRRRSWPRFDPAFALLGAVWLFGAAIGSVSTITAW